MKNVQINSANFNTNLPTTQKAQKSKPQEDAKPQLKEHCSSKAGQALKNVALGIMLAASVVAGAKAATIPAKAAETKEILPQTSYSQEVDAVSNSENASNNKTVTIACHGYFNKCERAMTSGFRNYEYVEINDDGTINFYTEERESASFFSDNEDKVYYTKETKNQFDLKGAIHKNNDYYETNMDIQAGTKFNEISNKYGDYVVMSENCVLNVYDKDDNKIGNVQFRDYKQIEDDRKEGAPIVLGALGALVVGGGAIAVKDIIDSNKIAENANK